MSIRSRAIRAMAGDDSSGGRALRAALSALVPAYAAGNALRSAGFATGVKRTYPLGRPTVSVGNLTTGGTGKTPMVGHVVRRLIARGHRPCILLRGYMGGDEALEHKLLLGDTARVQPNPDRVSAARQVLGEDPSVTCFVLDDGFQHRRARRDLDLVLLDATNPWGYGHLLPRGLMREPRGALRRADAVLVTRADQAAPVDLAKLDNVVQRITGRSPLAHAEHAWAALRTGAEGRLPLEHLAGLNVMGVAGIGNPEAFAATLRRHAKHVVHCEMLPDHHRYTSKLLLKLIDLAKTAGAEALVTTEKDWVKWSVLLEDHAPSLPVYRADLAMRFCDGEAALDALLDAKVPLPA